MKRLISACVGIMRAAAFIGATGLVFGGLMSNARADTEDATKLLKAMSDYLVSQANISATVDISIEVITPELQKLQFASSSSLVLMRPDKLRASRTGGYADVELVFDGKTATILGKHLNVFAQIASPGTTDQMFDRLRSEFSIEAPGADLLRTDVYEGMMAGVLDAKYIGHGVIGGIECDHLAFRNQDTDWQIWIERGPKPVPRKYVITSKSVAGAPQYTLVIRDWKTDISASAETFTFKAPAGARKLETTDLPHMDEVPASDAKGAKQ